MTFGSIQNVEPQIESVQYFLLQNGQVLPHLQIAYETYGTLNASGDNAVLIAHGYASHHHAAGFYKPGTSPAGIDGEECGWWDALIGPGKALDTNRLFIISSNTLGSSYGTTGPATIDPRTEKPYGPDFPAVTIVDMVNAQQVLLNALGIKCLKAVVGFSYGGYQAFQWAVTYPNMVKGVVVACSSPKGGQNPQVVDNLISRLSQDQNWNNGHYYDGAEITNTLTDYRIEMMKFYSTPQWLEKKFPDAASRDAQLRQTSTLWAKTFDGNSLVTLRRAAEYRDSEKDFARIKAKILYVLCRTDTLFPPTIASDVIAKLQHCKVDATYFELDSDHGHVGAISDALKWESALCAFIAGL